MNKLKIFCLTVPLYILPSFALQASQFNMVVSGGSIEQDSFVADGSRYIPTIWDTPFSVPTTLRWSPKLPVSRTTKVKLLSGKEQFEIEIEVMGFEYHIGSSIQDVPRDDVASCLKGSILSLARGICEDETVHYLLQSEEAPFVLIRPVIRFSREEVIQSLSGKPDGIYSGNINVESVFDYYWGDVKARRVLPINLEFVVSNRTDNIASVNIVSGDGKFFNRFSSGETLLSGNATYGISVEGKFSTGIELSLSSTRNSYEIQNSSDESKIPYTVKCNTCDDRVLVESGRLVSRKTTITSDFTRNVNFNLDFSYSDILTSNITSGEYTDTFYLFVGVDL